VVAGAEAQQRGGLVSEVGEDELAGRAVVHRDRRLGGGVDELGVDEAARAEVHAVLVLALAPQRDADVADAHGLGDLRAPAALEHRAEGGLAATGLAGDEDALDGRAVEVGGALEEMGGVGRRDHDRVGLQQEDRGEQAVGIAGPDGDVRHAEALEGPERGAGDERPGVVGGDDALAGRDARRGV